MTDTPLTLVVCTQRDDAQAVEHSRICANQDGLCTVVQLEPGGNHPANPVTPALHGIVLLLAPDAVPNARTIADARRLIETCGQSMILGSGYYAPDNPIAETANLEMAYRNELIAQKENLPLDASCAVFAEGSFNSVAGGVNACSSDAIHELACSLLALGREVSFEPEFKAQIPAPKSWKDIARLFFNQGSQLTRRLGAASNMGLTGRPWLPPAAWEALLILAAFGFAGLGFWHDTLGNFIRTMICLLLLYPVNRAFFKEISDQAPEHLNRAMALCLLRAPCRTLGLLKGALMRLAGPRDAQ